MPSDAAPGLGLQDVDAVDLVRYPALAAVEHWTAALAPGDCIYIPAGWYHQVRSARPRSLAVTVL